MSISQYTFGGNYNRGNAFWVYNSDDGGWAIFPTSDLSSPVSSSSTSTGRHTSAFGFDKIVTQVYTSRPFVVEWRSFDDTGAQSPGVYMDQTQAESLSNNYPYTIGFGNGRWMSMPFRTSSGGSVTGDVRVSTNGNGWTTYSGVLPAASGNCAVPVYNPDDGRWATCLTGTTTILYSDDDGATWSSTTAPVAVRALAYGNDTWVFAAATNGTVYSSDNLSTLTTVGGVNTNYTVHYNEWDQKFWLPAGFYTGSIFNARIYSSTDGVSWTTVYSGTAPLLLQEIIGDDSGNYIGMGIAYSGGYVDTAVYLYSTDNGATWTEGTLPTARRLVYGINQMVWASLTRGTPPAGSPPSPTYSVDVDTLSVNENGQTITWTINTTSVADGTTLYYRLDPFPTDGYSDFTDANYIGTLTINSNTATVSRTTSADSRTEGTDSVRLLLKVGGSGADDLTVAESDYTTISDTSQTPAPPSRAQPNVTSGATQTGSVPRSVYNTEEFSYSFQLTNSTPYSYTVDLKFKEDFLNENAGDISSTFTISSLTVGTVNGTLILPTGWDKDEAPNFNFTYLVDARNAPGAPDEVDFVISRTPYTINISPASGYNAGTYTQYSPSNPLNITLSGGEPNSPFNWQPISPPTGGSGTSYFDGSGNNTVVVFQPTAPGTYTWRVTFADLSTQDYTLIFTN